MVSTMIEGRPCAVRFGRYGKASGEMSRKIRGGGGFLLVLRKVLITGIYWVASYGQAAA